MATKSEAIPWWVQLGIAVVPAALVLVGTMWGGSLTHDNKDRELDIRMVEIALSILKGETTDSSRPAREYAIALLKQYPGDTKLDDKLWEAWIAGGDVPFASVTYGNTFSWEDFAKCAETDATGCFPWLRPILGQPNESVPPGAPTP